MRTVKRIASAALCAVLIFASVSLPSVAALSPSGSNALLTASRFPTSSSALLTASHFPKSSSAMLTASHFPKSSGKYVVKRYLGEALGITQERVVRWLSSHEHDDYYIGTPYTDLPLGTPNGDDSFILNETYSYPAYRPAMNCAGFVSHVLCKCGFDLEGWLDYMDKEFSDRWHEQDFDAGSANMWYLYLTGDDSGKRFVDPATERSDVVPAENGSDVFVCYAFNDTGEALSSGLLRKGDIVIYWPTEGFDHGYDGTIDSHIGFFWGKTSHSNRFWHSAGTGSCENKITNMHPMTKREYVMYVIPISPRSEVDEAARSAYWNSHGALGLAGLELMPLDVEMQIALTPGVFVPLGYDGYSRDDR